MVSMNRTKDQQEVSETVEEFLRRGGQIQEIPIGHSSERIQYRARKGGVPRRETPARWG